MNYRKITKLKLTTLSFCLLLLLVNSCKKEIQLTQPLVKNKTLSVTELQQALNTSFTKI